LHVRSSTLGTSHLTAQRPGRTAPCPAGAP
jgi:hypothetical protein